MLKLSDIISIAERAGNCTGNLKKLWLKRPDCRTANALLGLALKKSSSGFLPDYYFLLSGICSLLLL
jgi:hypothetical protein